MKLQPILLELTKFGMSFARFCSFRSEIEKLSGIPWVGPVTRIGINWKGHIFTPTYFIDDYRLFRDFLASQKLWTEEELSIFDPYICLELAED